jgi:hypothetical protein
MYARVVIKHIRIQCKSIGGDKEAVKNCVAVRDTIFCEGEWIVAIDTLT